MSPHAESGTIPVVRTDHRLLPDPRRVQARPHLPGLRVFPEADSRTAVIFRRLMNIPEDQVPALLTETLTRFASRHLDLELTLDRHFKLAAAHVGSHDAVSEGRRLLMGAYFTMEYSIESAALSNPSIVPAVDQSGLADGSRRFFLSLRAVGEGHISSIEFRAGVIDGGGRITLDPPSPHVRIGKRTEPIFSRGHVTARVAELGADMETCAQLLELVPERFRFEELERAVTVLDRLDVNRARIYETVKACRDSGVDFVLFGGMTL